MVLVDVYIPAVDESFDFMLDEGMEVEKLIMEICEMISKKIQGRPLEDYSDFMLYHMDSKRQLEKGRTLRMAGIRDGARLMLV